MKKLLDWLDQPSTWRGIVAVVTALGVTLSPDQSAAIITAGVSIVGLIEVFRNEKK